MSANDGVKKAEETAADIAGNENAKNFEKGIGKIQGLINQKNPEAGKVINKITSEIDGAESTLDAVEHPDQFAAAEDASVEEDPDVDVPAPTGGYGSTDSADEAGEAGCFLTTAMVGTLGLTDDCEPLTMARFLRDNKMQSTKDQAMVSLYYKVAPVIVSRSTKDDWIKFWRNHMQKITTLIKMGEYGLAKELYYLATAQLVNKKVSRYSDKEYINSVYDFGLKGVGKSWLPYSVRYGLLKLVFPFGLAYQTIRLGLKKRAFKKELAS
jgi:hypothetical protein